MTPSEIAADVAAIRARERRDDVLDARPVTLAWTPKPPVVVRDNTDSTNRGHRGDPCKDCKAVRPVGGHDQACPKGGLRRDFRGG